MIKNDFRNRSHEYLSNEFKDCFHDMYVTVLDRAEKMLKPNKSSKDWEYFRFGILNLGNDYMRKVDNILKEYHVEFRPLVFSVEYKGELPDSVDKVAVFEFGMDGSIPHMKVHMVTSEVALNSLEDIAELLECGKVTEGEKTTSLVISGMYDCFHKVIPFLVNKQALKGKTLERFNLWKEQVYEIEAGAGNVKKTN